MCPHCHNTGFQQTALGWRRFCTCPSGDVRRRLHEGAAHAIPVPVRPLPETETETETELDRFWAHIVRQMEGRVR